MNKNFNRRHEHGQSLVLLALVIVSILGIVGLSVDAGRLYFFWTGLSRATDAACLAVAPLATEMTNSQIRSTATAVVRHNLEEQRMDLSKLDLDIDIDRNARLPKVMTIQIKALMEDMPSVLMGMMGMKWNDVRAKSKCMGGQIGSLACPHVDDSCIVTSPGLYEAGVECQLICNNGRFFDPENGSCCPYQFYYVLGATESTCTCRHDPSLPGKLAFCDPDKPKTPPNPVPGLEGPIWFDRPLMNQYAYQCVNECHARGYLGWFKCNTDCRTRVGTVCCECECGTPPPPPCELPCGSVSASESCSITCNPNCMNGICEPGESCTTCPADCGHCPTACGNGGCDLPFENCMNCRTDCGSCPNCGNAICEPALGEKCSTCPDCTCGPAQICDLTGMCINNPSCGDGFMQPGENCETCPADAGACPASCPDGACGQGESCRNCPQDCMACPAQCGDGICERDESGCDCPADCGSYCPTNCGDGACLQETCQDCPADCGACGTCGDGKCTMGEDCTNCVPDCGECPGSCGDGTCGINEKCSTCAADCSPCDPRCGNFACEADECETCAGDCPPGSCPSVCPNGDCEAGETCDTCPNDCGGTCPSPSSNPSASPSSAPSPAPSGLPSAPPSVNPSAGPSVGPSSNPSASPSGLTCTNCPPPNVCLAGICTAPSPSGSPSGAPNPNCNNNGTCDANEGNTSCPSDCGSCPEVCLFQCGSASTAMVPVNSPNSVVLWTSCTCNGASCQTQGLYQNCVRSTGPSYGIDCTSECAAFGYCENGTMLPSGMTTTFPGACKSGFEGGTCSTPIMTPCPSMCAPSPMPSSSNFIPPPPSPGIACGATTCLTGQICCNNSCTSAASCPSQAPSPSGPFCGGIYCPVGMVYCCNGMCSASPC